MKTRFLLFVIVFISCFVTTEAQLIPNSSFESWTTVGSYEMPDSWDNLNPSTDSTGLYTCTKGTPGSAGSFFINLNSTYLPGADTVVPGIAVCGTIDQSSWLPVSGFAFGERPEQLTGKWQYMSFGGDNGYIEVILTKWNGVTGMRDTVAYALQKLIGMVHSWETFSIPLNYLDGSYPDSCVIVLDASGQTPADFDFLWVDDLAFEGNVIASTPSPGSSTDRFELFPNPSGPTFSARFMADKKETVQLMVYDENGVQLIKTSCNVLPGINVLPIFMQNGKPGVYLVTIQSSACFVTKKMILR